MSVYNVLYYKPVSKTFAKRGRGGKIHQYFRPQPGCHIPNSPHIYCILLFLARESLVSDFPAGDGKIANHFLQCRGDCEQQGGKFLRLLSQLRPRIRPLYKQSLVFPNKNRTANRTNPIARRYIAGQEN
jgi:hypothetical protein